MNRIKGLFGLGAAVAAALTLGACSQDETAGGDGALSPMELTATGLEPMVTPMTRATVDGDWTDVDAVAVEVGSEVKLYIVADGATTEATLTSNDPFYWQASGSETVSAWWPYNEADIKTKPAVKVKSDQSGDGYAASDFIEAVAQSVTKGDPKLVFTHRTAKICVKLTAADGSELTNATVSIAVGGQTVEKCFASDGGHLALIAPTAAAAELTVTITDNGGKNYVYKHTAVKYDANSQYTFNLKLKGDEVVALSGCTITGWDETTLVEDGTAVEDPGFTVDAGTYHVTSAKGLEVWAKTVKKSGNDYINCVLEDDIVMPDLADGETSNWTPISSFAGTFDGNGHTITRLVVNKTGDNVGFIADNNGTVKNLTLENAKITAGEGVVGAVAVVNNGTIENCHVTGESVITGGSGNVVGGVVSYNSGTILACHVANGCKVSGSSQVGGIAGSNRGQISGCYALCSLTGSDAIGGICGEIYIGLTACYSKCSYSSGNNIGGIVGKDAAISANFSACYWQEAENCSKGVGSGMNNNPSGVTKIYDANSWHSACISMNTALGSTYQYEYYGDADEPLVLVKTQQ